LALKRIAFGTVVLSAARIFQLVSSFVAIPFLARMLTPNDFGLVAMATSVVVFFTYIADAGLGRSLVRTHAGDTEAWSSAHWAVMGLTCALALVIVALASPAADFFNEPRLAAIMMTLALAPVLMGFVEIPACALLQKEKFHWLSAGEFASALGGIIVALWVAISGGGAWALVWQHLTQRIIKAAVLIPASGFTPRLMFNWRRLGEHSVFVRDTTAWSVMTFFSKQADTIIIGKFLGATTLGLYNVAVRIMQLPVNVFGASLSSTVYPRMVQLRENNAALRDLVLMGTAVQAAVVFPPIAAVAVASDAFFTLLLSDRWTDAGAIFTLLATAAAVQTVVGLNGSLLQAVGRTGARLRLTVEYAVIWVTAALILSQFGIHAVALGSSATTVLYLPRLLQLYLRPINCSLMDFVRALAGPALAAVLVVASHWTITTFADLDAWPEVGVAALETLAAYILIAWFGRHAIAGHLAAMSKVFSTQS
jgi:PST family polysaccharide transporter